jgi:hypothetical protein
VGLAGAYNFGMTKNETTATIATIVADITTGGDMDTILDAVMDIAGDMTILNVITIMDAAHTVDPTESGIAAEIRDAIRDNSDHTV